MSATFVLQTKRMSANDPISPNHAVDVDQILKAKMIDQPIVQHGAPHVIIAVGYTILPMFVIKTKLHYPISTTMDPYMTLLHTWNRKQPLTAKATHQGRTYQRGPLSSKSHEIRNS